MQTMYPGKVNSPQTELASAIDATQTSIPVLDASKLPAAPNLATIGNGEDAETILYTGVSGNDLIGVTRGFQGSAKAWNVGAKVARYFTAYDHDAFIENINTHASRHAIGGDDPLTPEMIGAETPAGAQDKADAAAAAGIAAASAVQDNLDNHAGRTDNPHAVTKAQVGLGNVQNYGIASQAQAETGSASNVYMTPQRTKQYVDTRLLNDIKFRINDGAVEYNDGTGWKSMVAVKRVLRGVTAPDLTPVNVMLSPVDFSKSVVIVTNYGIRSASSPVEAYARLINSTTLEVGSNGAGGADVHWQVVEYY